MGHPGGLGDFSLFDNNLCNNLAMAHLICLVYDPLICLLLVHSICLVLATAFCLVLALKPLNLFGVGPFSYIWCMLYNLVGVGTSLCIWYWPP